MARFFDDGATEYLEIDSTPITAAPFTIGCWFYSDDATANQDIVCISDKDVADQKFSLLAAGNVGGDPIAFGADAGGFANALTSSGYTADTWHHACAVATSPTSRAVYIDGGSKGTNTTSRVPANLDRISIARRGDSSPSNYFSGGVAEVGLWNVALSDAEVATLAQGFSPLFIQPDNLVGYWRLIRDDDNDLVGGYDLSALNTPTVATHPPKIIYPSHKG